MARAVLRSLPQPPFRPAAAVCIDGSKQDGAVKGAVNEFAQAHGLSILVTYKCAAGVPGCGCGVGGCSLSLPCRMAAEQAVLRAQHVSLFGPPHQPAASWLPNSGPPPCRSEPDWPTWLARKP